MHKWTPGDPNITNQENFDNLISGIHNAKRRWDQTKDLPDKKEYKDFTLPEYISKELAKKQKARMEKEKERDMKKFLQSTDVDSKDGEILDEILQDID